MFPMAKVTIFPNFPRKIPNLIICKNKSGHKTAALDYSNMESNGGNNCWKCIEEINLITINISYMLPGFENIWL